MMHDFFIAVGYKQGKERLQQVSVSDEDLNSFFENPSSLSSEFKLKKLQDFLKAESYLFRQQFAESLKLNRKISVLASSQEEEQIADLPNSKGKGIQVLMGAKNAEKYLPEMLKSIERVFKNVDKWAFITLNDCSEDATSIILKEHQSSCSKRIHIKNESASHNVSHVKNKLFQIAKTIQDEYPYVYMVDADDEVLPAILDLYEEIKESNADCIIGSHEVIDLEGKSRIANANNFYDYKFCFGTWASIINLKCVPNDGLCFRSEYPCHEDAMFYARMLFNKKNIICKNTKPVYRHFLRQGSVSIGSDQEKRKNNWFRFQDLLSSLFEEEKVKSFCTIATKDCWNEFVLMAKTLRRHHNEPLIVCGDGFIKYIIEKYDIQNCEFHKIELEEVKRPYWADVSYHNFKPLTLKYLPIEKALEVYENTLFVDSDFIFLQPFEDQVRGDLAVTPHHRLKEESSYDQMFGEYNTGLIFVRDKYFPQWWKDSIYQESRFTDQHCVNNAKTFFFIKEFDQTHNIGFWRVCNSDAKKESIQKALKIEISEDIFINGKKANSFHVHAFLNEKEGHWINFRNFVLDCLKRCEKHNWILKEIEQLK
jgi:hypothetical protein